VAEDVVYVSKVLRLAMLDVEGAPIGPVADVVIGPPTGADQGPPVRGFVASVQRRRIFVAASRIGWLDARGLQLATGDVDLRQFQPRGDELSAKATLGADLHGDTVRDIGLAPSTHMARAWTVATVAVRHRGALRRAGGLRVLPWRDAVDLFRPPREPETVRAIRGLHPSDAALELLALAPDEQSEVIDRLSDRFLADILEELPEPDQVVVLDRLELERAADVVEEMDPDDATDLLLELAGHRRQQLLAAIEPERGARLRRLLSHDAHTAGGLMTSDPVVVAPGTSVAEALARIRHPDVPPALAAQVFVAEPPLQTPTGTFRGTVTCQRLLREPPATTMADCIGAGTDPIDPDLPELAVAQRLAAYDLLAVPVCDGDGRLLGAVTVDDVLDRSLPTDWRQR
jgi:CBS domain-containing protein